MSSKRRIQDSSDDEEVKINRNAAKMAKKLKGARRLIDESNIDLQTDDSDDNSVRLNLFSLMIYFVSLYGIIYKWYYFYRPLQRKIKRLQINLFFNMTKANVMNRLVILFSYGFDFKFIYLVNYME